MATWDTFKVKMNAPTPMIGNHAQSFQAPLAPMVNLDPQPDQEGGFELGWDRAHAEIAGLRVHPCAARVPNLGCLVPRPSRLGQPTWTTP